MKHGSRELFPFHRRVNFRCSYQRRTPQPPPPCPRRPRISGQPPPTPPPQAVTFAAAIFNGIDHST
ncbi:hypothetical protein E2C01_090216 [Portunus trituberculatus]|uniref:Uncharacterized protein n=1 Tax=Portunus trituberculatus TaxID=210409 RepID=A0A5B7JRM0_PORTR|nr:hypothetical protein [Portunus trituberculatus]